MNHMMIDIETLGKDPSSMVLEIGYAVFDRTEVLEFGTFCPDLGEQKINFRYIDVETLSYWLQKSSTFASIMRSSMLSGTPVNWCKDQLTEIEQRYDVQTWWAKSPSFDMVILEDLFGGEAPWEFRQLRDVRTLVALSGVKTTSSSQVTHRGAEDAVLQVGEVWAALDALGIRSLL